MQGNAYEKQDFLCVTISNRTGKTVLFENVTYN
jgi:hypothetical protein